MQIMFETFFLRNVFLFGFVDFLDICQQYVITLSRMAWVRGVWCMVLGARDGGDNDSCYFSRVRKRVFGARLHSLR